MTDVFISYSRKDKDFVRQLYDEFQTVGREAWVDWESIPLSVDWWNEICGGIEASDAFICVMTPDSLSSHVCHAEIAYAFERNKRMIPLLLTQIDEQKTFAALMNTPPDENARQRLNGRDPMAAARDNWQRLSSLNWALFQNQTQSKDQFQKLLGVLDTDLAHVKLHTRLLLRAREWERAKENVSFLLRGAELQEAETWLASAAGKDPIPTELHQRYINASRTAQRQRQRVQFSAVSIALAVMTVLAILAFVLARVAQNNADLADRRAAESYSLSMAANAQQALAVGNLDLAVPLALEAESIENAPARAHDALTAAAYSLGTRLKLEGHDLRINAVAYSPDGKSLASAGSDRLLLIWDAQTGQERSRMQFDQPISALAYLPDGQHILVALIEEIVLVKLDTQEVEKQYSGHRQLVSALAIDNTGTLMVTADRAGQIIFWNIATATQTATLTAPAAVKSLAINADATQVITADAAGFLTLWDAATKQEIRHWQASENALEAVRFSLDGSSALSVGDDNIIAYWDVRTGKEHWRKESESAANIYLCLALSPDGRFAAMGGNGQTLQLWDLSTGQRIANMLGHSGSIVSVAFSPDGKTVATASWDTTVRLWQVTSYNELTRYDTIGYVPASSMVTADGNAILIGTDEGTILDIDLQAGKQTRQLIGHSTRVASVAVSRDGKYVLSGGFDGSLRWWDRQTGQELKRHDLGKDSIITTVALTPDDKQAIFFFCQEGDVSTICAGKVWSIESWAELRELRDDNLDTVTMARISPDGRYVAAGFSGPSEAKDLFNDEGGILLWELATGNQLKRVFGHNTFVNNIVFSADGKFLLTTSHDRTTALWDAQTLTLIRRVGGHLDYVYSADFSPDGRYLITAGRDSQIILWDRELGTKIMAFTGHTSAIIDVLFLADGRRLLSVGRDGTVRTWQMPLVGDDLVTWALAHHYIRELTCTERVQFALTLRCDAAGLAPTRTPFLGRTPVDASPVTLVPASSVVVQVPTATPVTPTVTPTGAIFPTVNPVRVVSDAEIAVTLSDLNFSPYLSRGTPHWQLTDVLKANASDIFGPASVEKVTGKVLALTYENGALQLKVVQYQTAFADAHELAEHNLNIKKTIPGVAEYFTLQGIDVLDFNAKALTGDTVRYFMFVKNNVEVNIISQDGKADVALVKELIEALLTEKVMVATAAPLPTLAFQFPPSPTFLPKK
ncbi:MAG: TIR domain-containing protein [Anaerolineae bacterium]|nr:TIR domain-containing protein [Anaerolineae bacterium]